MKNAMGVVGSFVVSGIGLKLVIARVCKRWERMPGIQIDAIRRKNKQRMIDCFLQLQTQCNIGRITLVVLPRRYFHSA